MLTPEHQHRIRQSVLCWLATADANGQPNVSPKEVFAVADPEHLVIAHIASPVSVRNLAQNPKACVSVLDVFVQKGLKLHGTAQLIQPDDARFADNARPLLALTGGRFPIRAVIRFRVESVAPILAPSYTFIPGTTEAAQVAAALATYGVAPLHPKSNETSP